LRKGTFGGEVKGKRNRLKVPLGYQSAESLAKAREIRRHALKVGTIGEALAGFFRSSEGLV